MFAVTFASIEDRVATLELTSHKFFITSSIEWALTSDGINAVSPSDSMQSTWPTIKIVQWRSSNRLSSKTASFTFIARCCITGRNKRSFSVRSAKILYCLVKATVGQLQILLTYLYKMGRECDKTVLPISPMAWSCSLNFLRSLSSISSSYNPKNYSF